MNLEIKISIIILVIGTVLIVIFAGFFNHKENKDLINQDIIEIKTEEQFSNEMLISQIPSVVIFTSDGLWKRDKNIAPNIAAIKEIIVEKRYEDKINFYKYTVVTCKDNNICEKVNVSWLPTIVIFKDESVIEKFEGGGCTIKESKTKLEEALENII